MKYCLLHFGWFVLGFVGFSPLRLTNFDSQALEEAISEM